MLMRVQVILLPLKIYIIISFKTYGISLGIYKLVRTFILINKQEKRSLAHMSCFFYLFFLNITVQTMFTHFYL